MPDTMVRAEALTRPWGPNRPRDLYEQKTAAVLRELGLEYAEEDTLLEEEGRPMFGICPDFRLFATTMLEGQYIEVTGATARTRLKEKAFRIRQAQDHHRVQITLVLANRPRYRPQGVVAIGLEALETDPSILLTLLRSRKLHLLKQPA